MVKFCFLFYFILFHFHCFELLRRWRRVKFQALYIWFLKGYAFCEARFGEIESFVFFILFIYFFGFRFDIAGNEEYFE